MALRGRLRAENGFGNSRLFDTLKAHRNGISRPRFALRTFIHEVAKGRSSAGPFYCIRKQAKIIRSRMVSEAEIDYAIALLSDSLGLARTMPELESDCERMAFMLSVLLWVKQMDNPADPASFSALINDIKAVDTHCRQAENDLNN